MRLQITGFMKQLSIVCGLLIAAGSLFAQQQYSMSTSRGNRDGRLTGDLGPALAPVRTLPSASAVDAAGNIYVTDYLNSAIREVYTRTGP